MSFGHQSRRRTDGTVVVIGAGQSGLAAARALLERNVATVVLEAVDRAAGSWPYYYDSLQAFSPAGFNSMPGMPFPGDQDRYPARDEVADYLERYAAGLGAEIRTNTPVVTVSREDGEFVLVTAGGSRLRAAGVVAASGSFSNPLSPRPPLVYLGLEYQRSFASNTLRGVSADASAVIAPLLAWIREAPRTVGLTTPQIHAPTFVDPRQAAHGLDGTKIPAATALLRGELLS
jgi:glycine/D-amino acid oxidase-like deaminating enzyme